MTGIITDIQRFSLKDGPGIRTTVFFKGCNMACRWCHNPETLAFAPQLLHRPGSCIHCGVCAAACPTGALQIKEGEVMLNRQRCKQCGACADVCFSGALEMSGQSMDTEAVMAQVRQDADYYRGSGGGLTLSGGEVTVQAAFAKALLTAAKGEGIHTAIETNLLADWAVYADLLPLTDLVMADIKLMDGEAHQCWTGVGNARILENLTRLAESGKPYILRTPVIPGVNDSPAAIGEIAEFVCKLSPPLYYELLLFNPLGESKYTALQMENPFAGARPAADTDSLLAAARAAGCELRMG